MLVILGLTLISLLCSLYHSKEVPSENYFLFSSRIFEFLIGSCIAIMPIERFVVNKYVLNSVAFLALITLFFIAHLDNIRMAYPNGYAIAVCVATGILVISGSPTVALNFNSQPLLISRVLSIRPVVFIGVLSYSLYIWHWLVFAILRYQSVYESTAVLSLTYAVIFILAYLSWRFIEKPSKKLKHFKFSYTFKRLFD
jgi:peptidoglycan/LPS O-acetylase OafA/YrhL